jgi:cob(I)alamin adenosyltransferase
MSDERLWRTVIQAVEDHGTDNAAQRQQLQADLEEARAERRRAERLGEHFQQERDERATVARQLLDRLTLLTGNTGLVREWERRYPWLKAVKE